MGRGCCPTWVQARKQDVRTDRGDPLRRQMWPTALLHDDRCRVRAMLRQQRFVQVLANDASASLFKHAFVISQTLSMLSWSRLSQTMLKEPKWAINAEGFIADIVPTRAPNDGRPKPNGYGRNLHHMSIH